MKVLITGAGGMLGQDMVLACERRGHDVVAATRGDLDIRSASAIEAVLAQARPDCVVNCAAWTDVEGAESHEPEAMALNDEAAALLAGCAASQGATYVFISSDYVFDGSRRSPYVESDMPNPLSAYGRSKLGGETSVAAINARHFIVRTSWLFGHGGRNFVETMLRLAAEQPEVLVVSDQVGCPTYTPHFAAAVANLIAGSDYGIHHVAGGGHCSWYEFAQEIFDAADLETSVLAATTEMIGSVAPRPAFSVLRSERSDPVQLPSWRRSLNEYLAERAPASGAMR